MGKQNKRMEDLLRDKLQGYKRPVGEQDWLDFQARREGRRKRRPFFLFLIMLLSAGISVCGLFADQTGQLSLLPKSSDKPLVSNPVVVKSESEADKSTEQIDADRSSRAAGSKDNESSRSVSAKSDQDINLSGSSDRAEKSSSLKFTDRSTDPKPIIPVIDPGNNDEGPGIGNPIAKDPTPLHPSTLQPEEQGRIFLNVPLIIPPADLLLTEPEMAVVYPLKPLKEEKKPDRPEFHPFGVYMGYTYAVGSSPWMGPGAGDSSNTVNRALVHTRAGKSLTLFNNGIRLGATYTFAKGFGLDAGLSFSRMNRNYYDTVHITEYPIINADDQIIAYVPLNDSFYRSESIIGSQQIQNISIPL